MSVEIGKLLYTVDSDLTPVERGMRQLPQIVEQAVEKSRKRTEASLRASYQVSQVMSNATVRDQRRVTNEILRELDRREKAAIKSASNINKSLASGSFSGSFKGSFLGTIGAGILGEIKDFAGMIPAEINKSFNKALDFGQSEMGLAAITGSMDLAQKKILELERVAMETPGLSFLSAVDGQKRLEAVGFEAGKATDMLKNLSKVRVLSGATKQDYDAVIMNLTQIRANGRLTGDELRETLGRMPYMARVINDAFGTINTEKIKEMNISSDEFFAKMLASMEKVPPVAGGANLAVENFYDSVDRLEISIGRLLEQNPYVIALFRLWQEEIDGVTKNLSDQDKQQAKTYSNFITWLARGAVHVENLGDKTQAFFTDLINDAKLGGTILKEFFSLVIQSAELAFVDASLLTDKFIDKLNTVLELIQSIPTTVKMSIGIPVWLDALPKLSKSGYSEDYRNELSRQQKETGSRYMALEREWAQNNRPAQVAASERAQRRLQRFDEIAREEADALAKRATATYKGLDWKGGNGTGDGKLTADAKKAGRELERIREEFFIGKKSLSIGDGLELRKNLEKMLDDPQVQLWLETVKRAEGGAPNIMAGGRRVSSLATHPGEQVPMSQWFVGPKGPSSAAGNWQITRTNWRQIAPQLGIKDFSVQNQAIVALEIMRRQSQSGFVELAKGNLEDAFKKGTQPWASSSFSTLPGGKKNYINLARQINGAGNFSLDTEKQSETLARDERDRQTRTMETLMKSFGNLPSDELLKNLTDLRKREAEKLGTIPPSEADVLNEFMFGRTVSTPEAKIGTGISFRKTVDEEYISLLRDSLGIEEKAKEYVLARRNYEADIAERLKAETIGQDLELLSIERQIQILARQNANETFVAKRRELSVSNEILSLNRESAALQDELATLDSNAAYRAQVNLLRETVDLRRQGYEIEAEINDFWVNSGARIDLALNRERLALLQKEEDAMINIQLAQMKLSGAWAISNNEIKAKTLEAIASQQNLTGLIGDLQAGAITDAYSAIDDGVSRLVESLGMANTAAGNFFNTMISGLAKLALQEAFKLLFGAGSSQNGAQQSSGGGWLGKLIGWGIGAIGGAFGGKIGGGASSASSSLPHGLTLGGSGYGTMMAHGGIISGGIKGVDSVPILAMPDEFISRVSAVDYYGKEFYQALNEKRIPRELLIPQKMAAGGIVSMSGGQSYAPSFSARNYTSSNSAGVNQTVINNNFYANPKTGAFSKPSAEQEAKRFADMQARAVSRR